MDGIKMKDSKLINKAERPALAEMLRRIRKALRLENIKGKISIALAEGRAVLRIHGSPDDRRLVRIAINKHIR